MHIEPANISRLRDYRNGRVSSFDRTGGNRDWVDVAAGETRVLAEIAGPGIIRHIWMTFGFPHDDYLRRVILRMFWDDCPQPSVECPIGDFFGLGHAKRKNFTTAMLSMSPQDGRACNSWWPMPFRSRARIEVANQGDASYPHYFYIDYESCDAPAMLDGQAFFHTQWRRENPTRGWGAEYDPLVAPNASATQPLSADSRFFEPRPKEWFDKCWFGSDPRSLNRGPRIAENYVMLAAAGDGIYCGGHLNIDIFTRQKNDWYGEGDDMTFIDDDLSDDFDATAWAAMIAAGNETHAAPTERLAAQLRRPPTLHGTGTEDWNNCAFCPSEEFSGPYHGVLLYSGSPAWRWRGKQSIYRYYIADPIRFRKRILATIEHGHANKLSNDYSSTAYYYLAAPQRGGPPLPPVAARLPRTDSDR